MGDTLGAVMTLTLAMPSTDIVTVAPLGDIMSFTLLPPPSDLAPTVAPSGDLMVFELAGGDGESGGSGPTSSDDSWLYA